MNRRRALAPLVALPLFLASCSSSGTDDEAVAQPTGTATSTGVPTASAAATTGTRPTSGSTKTPATTGPTSSTTTTAPVARPLTTRAPGRAAASEATPAGTYTYDTSGTVTYNGAPSDVSGSATLVVTAVRDGYQTSTLKAESADTEHTVLVRDSGSYLAALHLTTQAFDEEFRPSPAGLLLPDPAKVGTSWAWDATSTDGDSTVRTSHRVVRTETITVGGKAVQTVVLQSRIAISGSVTYTADVTTWVVPSLRLPVKDRTVGKGTFGAFQVTTDTTSVMRSLTPA